MLLAKLLLIFVVSTFYCNAAPLLTQEMKNSISGADVTKEFLKKLTPGQILDLFLDGIKILSNETLTDEEQKAIFMEKLKNSHPQIYNAANAIDEEMKRKVDALSLDAKNFTEFYEARKSHHEINPFSSDKTFKNFVCDVLPKWYELNENAKDEIGKQFPNIFDALNSRVLRRAVNCSNE